MEDAKEKELKSGIRKHKKISSQVMDISKEEMKARNHERVVIIFATIATASAGTAFLLLPELSILEVGVIFGGISVLWLIFAFYFLYKSFKVVDTKDKKLMQTWVISLSMGASVAAGFTFIYTISNELLSRILLVVALLWLLMATYFLHSHLDSIRNAKMLRSSRRIEHGVITYVDHEDEAPILVSEEYCLRGRPDYILFKNEEYVPVEEKTGRTPRGPYFSHIMQMASYCLLVRENLGKCTQGLLKYEKKDFNIELDARTVKTFKDIRKKMESALKNDDFHRNHNRKGKCAGCSRKEECPESLA